MKIISIIQARMGSSRLEGKVLMKIGEKRVIDHVLDRVSKSKYIDEIVVATSIDENNLPLVSHVASRGYKVYAGSENDVLDRFYQITKLIDASHIVRITADCPFIDPEVIDLTIKKYLESDVDYCFNCGGDKVYPDGMDVEVFSVNSLIIAWGQAVKNSDREHVTSYIRSSGNFRVTSLVPLEDYSKVRITLDEESDFKVLTLIYDNLKDKNNFKLVDIIDIIEKNPNIAAINCSIGRNEGYLKSLKND